jgi:acetyltransferase-like isoleucine patch superfamily enzyme
MPPAGKTFLILRGLPKTVRFNLKYLPLAQAIRLPIIVSHRVSLDHLKGRIDIQSAVRPGMIRVGFGEVGIFDRRRARTIWRVDGLVIFKGTAAFGHGTRLLVEGGGVLTLGDDFYITAESAILCRKAVTFGKRVLISWGVQIMDSDWHAVTDLVGVILNPDAEVIIGDHVWLGSHSLVLKGAKVADDCIVAAGSVVTRAFGTPNVVLGGVPAGEIKHGVSWN